MLTRTENLPSVARRMAAGQMLVDGATVHAVADSLHLSAQTVRRYKTIVEDGGLAALQQMSVGGRPSVLDQAALGWIALALHGSARDHGFASDAWTNSRVRELIGRQFGVHYSRVYTWQIVSNLGLGHRLSKSAR
ncbi:MULTISPECIES: helix-turn-helix domain-containing protein [unclassified Paraburkholderia]|uniref:helix-turn-helix domain-containing protein n=1 Tax=unclassified Paraburkholderia TaxID=2615204 RepID=UPI00197CF805|nr:MULTISPECIES: helix-turn-helix domain-containing protein [unclassified Paraburkholderia]MBN3856454.1 transposase [Paraburkholderia sp. Ac-20340]